MAISSIILSHEEKRIREFYRIVYLLSSLGLRRGDRIKRGDRSDRGIPVEQKIISVAKYRRNVADALAYISAYDKTPARVTAVALGIEEGRLVVWIAANQEVKPEVEDFLTSVLSRLDQIARGPESECDDLVDFVLRFNWKGVQKYYEKFGSEWASYYEPHQSSGHNVLRELDDWVQETCPKPGKVLEPEDMANLARKCYYDRKRNGGVFDMLNEASKQGIMPSKVSERLCNLLYKIGKHITLCLNLIDARMSLTEDFKHGAVVKPVCVPAQHLDRTERKYSFGSITTHIFPSESEKQTFYGHVDHFHDREVISEKLQTYVKKPPRVHAEIQLINHFDTNNSPLLEERNPYIGCSKPACYLCYKYIADHPRQWFRPPSHQKLYNSWGLPKPRGKENREEFLATTAEVLQRELREDIANKRGPRSEYDDSTAGVTSVPHICAMKREGYVNPQSTVDRAMVAGHGKAGPLSLHEWLLSN
ncbi:hypothetical protein BDV41DRAFT_542661 [Aspergillus transmontanensis]|uniref:OTT1508-like deaminase n=1 Tax=Aspergillus transmontanensis TaxID=1034304 RepID=A0A5N6VRS9_9EURO|nr:hypothetical protein BDV41DRAFT_542661 [Aspergillus transmontanensis]